MTHRGGIIYLCVVQAFLWGSAAPVRSQGLVYVDAKDTFYDAPNLFTVTGAQIDGSQPAILDPNVSTSGDNAWGWDNFGVPDSLANATSYTTVYESIEEDSPEIVMRLGLEPGLPLDNGTQYDVYVVYWGDTVGNWGIRGGFSTGTNNNTTTPSTNQLFDSDGALEGAIMGSFGASAVWSTPPLDNMTDELPPDGVPYFASDDNDDPFNDSTPGGPDTSDRLMRLGFVGTTTPTGGTIDVYIDDVPNPADSNQRTFFDGLAFVPSGNPVFITGTVDRQSGNLTITNPTGVDLQVTGYTLDSPSGSLNGTNWQTEASNGILGDPNGDWTVTSGQTESELQLTEADTGNMQGAVFANSGDTIDFGNVWRSGPFEDLSVLLTLSSGQILTVTPEFTGVEIADGDFNADGVINTADYLALVNGLHLSQGTNSLAYALGDTNADGRTDVVDVVNFQRFFDAANGTGSFSAMVAGLSVPEPSTALLAVLCCGLLASLRRRLLGRPTAAICGIVFLTCGVASAEPVINWQVDPLVTGGSGPQPPVLLNAETNSPTIGDGAADGADQVAIWGATPTDVVLENGRQVTLSGRVTITGGSQAGNQSFRFGIFNKVAGEPDDVGGWLGYMAGVSGDGNDGLLSVRNPDAGDWLTATPVSTLTLGAPSELGNTTTRVFPLGQGGGTDAFINGTYDFSITIGRYGDEVTVNASTVLVGADGAATGDYNNDGTVGAADYVVWRNNLNTNFALPNEDPAATPGMVTMEDYDAWVANFGASGPSYTFNLLASDSDSFFPVAETALGTDEMPFTEDDTWTSHLTFEFNRVAILMANHLNADVAEFENVDISQGDIEALELSVDRGTGVVTLVNNTGESFDLNYYEITSREGVLNEANWNTLADGTVIDGVEWDVAPGSDETILSEINLLGTSLMAPANTIGIYDFGPIYNGSSEADERLSFFFTQSSGELVRGIVTYTGAYSGSASAVPEPGTLGSLLLVSLLGSLPRTRRLACMQTRLPRVGW